VHLAVVDPGVGTQRAMISLEFAGQLFIAPDNGLLDAVPGDAPNSEGRIFGAADLVDLQLPIASHTFHGRDIFAPLVAEIAAGRQQPDSLGTPLRRAPATVDRNRDHGQILWADHYGNLVTDIAAERLSRFVNPALLFRQQRIQLKDSYGYSNAGELLALVNSWGTLEIAEAKGNARQRLQATAGEPVQLVETA
jgi:S-adenosylmethionine hydrolase